MSYASPHGDLRQGREETIDEALHIAVGVVEGHRRHAEYVWLAPVAHSSAPNQPVANGTAAVVYSNGELRSAAVRLARGEHSKVPRRMVIEQKLEVSGQRLTFLTKLLPARGGEYL